MGIEEILVESRMNLDRGRAVATGIGLFLVVINKYGNPLLRRRSEKGSLFGDDLSGKWEPPGGGMDLEHLEYADAEEPKVSKYHRPILQTLVQELDEETGLKLVENFPLVMVPAVFSREYEHDGEKRESIDFAFSVPVPFSACEQTNRFSALMKAHELMFVPRGKLADVDFVSPRIKFLVVEVIKFHARISV